MTESATAPAKPASGGDAGISKRTILAICVALFVVGLGLYLPSLWFSFVQYDDVRIVLDHPRLYDEHSFLASLREIFVVYFPREEPLLVRDVTWAINSRVFGFKNAFGYHLGNVLLNAANAPLLFLFLQRATGRVRFATVVAALFSLLPVHVDAVCWVMGRKDVLSAFFALLTLLCEAEAFRAEDRRRARLLQVLGVLFCSLAVLSKISAVPLALVVAAYRMLAPAVASRGAPEDPARSVRPTFARLLSLCPYLIVSGVAFLWYERILRHWGAFAGAEPLPPAPLAESVRMVPLTIGLYVKSLFALSEYSIAYQWPDSGIPLTSGEAAIAVAVGVAMLGFLVWAARNRRDLFFYFFTFLALMLPYMHVVSVTRWRADRYLYLSSFCILAIAVQSASDLLALAGVGLRRAVVGAGLVWALSAILVTATIEPRFHDNHSLWSYEVGLRRPSVTAYVALASSFVDLARSETNPTERQRLLAEAERVARAGIDYYASIPWRANAAPKFEYANLHVQLGQVSGLRGEPLSAQLAHYRESYRILPNETNILFLAQTLYKMAAARGDLELARKSLRLFSELVAGRSGDSARRPVRQRVLDLYRQTFPALAPDLDAIEKAYLR
ncbi:MAG: cellulose synthase subunit BcsC [bacterium]|nr:cellulose synthase subunit BcsC [bacterium]